MFLSADLYRISQACEHSYSLPLLKLQPLPYPDRDPLESLRGLLNMMIQEVGQPHNVNRDSLGCILRPPLDVDFLKIRRHDSPASPDCTWLKKFDNPLWIFVWRGRHEIDRERFQ